MRISEKQLLVLQYLARYTYLTAPHLVSLGISKHRNHVTGRYLKPLIEGRSPLVKFRDYSLIEGGRNARKPRLYALTKKGAEVLADHFQTPLDSIYYTKNPKEIDVVRDYTHRTRTIDLLISFDRASEHLDTENIFDPYFCYTGSQRKKGSQLTSLAAFEYSGGYFVPDANLVHTKDNRKDLYTLELERQPKSKRIIQDKIMPHAQIIAEGVLSAKYNHPLSHRALFAFESFGTMHTVASFVATAPELSELQEHFLFAMYNDIKTYFWGWKTAVEILAQ